MTNGLRIEITQQKTRLTGLHMASTDTEMTATLNVPKNSSQAVTRAALDGFEAGELGIFADEDTRAVKAALSVDPVISYPQAVRHTHRRPHRPPRDLLPRSRSIPTGPLAWKLQSLWCSITVGPVGCASASGGAQLTRRSLRTPGKLCDVGRM